MNNDQVRFIREMTDDIEAELIRSMKYPLFHSNHEAYGVLLEEVDELWYEVKADKGVEPTERMREEAIQIAAMAIKFCMR